MLDIFHAVIMGIVEGFTEFLPISSTAHLILTANLLKIPQTDYVKSFEIIIQLGAIMAVVLLYWKKFIDLDFLKKLAVAFIPTGILGLLFYKIVKNYLLGNIAIVLWSLAVGGLILILFEKYSSKKDVLEDWDIKDITYKQCLFLGLFQSISMIPGVSRSAATIIGGLSLGIPKKTIVEFSFLLAVPTMAAATGLDLLKNASLFSVSQIDSLAIGFLTSFIMAILSIRWLLNYIRKNSFTAFGVYRIALAILCLFFI
ncbi:MAG: undecaprenyl-diphosphate phosphatase [Parcubacteria group bacterium]